MSEDKVEKVTIQISPQDTEVIELVRKLITDAVRKADKRDE